MGAFDSIIPSGAGRQNPFANLIPRKDPAKRPPEPGRLPSDIPRMAQEQRAYRAAPKPVPGAAPGVPGSGALVSQIAAALQEASTPSPMSAPTSPAVPTVGGSYLAAAPTPMPTGPLGATPSPDPATRYELPDRLAPTPRPPAGEPVPSKLMGPVMEQALQREFVSPTARPLGGKGYALTGQDRSHIMSLTRPMGQDAMLAALSFVQDVTSSGAMNVNDAIVYAMENLVPGKQTQEVERNLLGKIVRLGLDPTRTVTTGGGYTVTPPPDAAPPAAPSQSLPRLTSKEEYEAAPSGTRFIAPDGSVRVKP